MTHFLLVLLPVLFTGASYAAAAQERWYQVEVIVFRHNDLSLAGEEQWPPLQAMPDFSKAVQLLTDLPQFVDEPDAGDVNGASAGGPIAFQALPADELEIADVFRHLARLAAYEPVLHVGWRQPGPTEGAGQQVHISDKPARSLEPVDAISDPALAEPVYRRIEGAVAVHIGHLLHVTADFVSHEGELSVRISEHRKVKLKELHYFDHPLFGVIVQVVPYRDAGDEVQTVAD